MYLKPFTEIDKAKVVYFNERRKEKSEKSQLDNLLLYL